MFAAGKGVRLEPLTSRRPKHLLPVAGAPLIEHTLRSLKSAGIIDVLIVVHHMKGQIQSCLGNGSRFGLRLEYADQGGVFGTADALSLGRGFMGNDPFLVVYGDLALHPSVVKEVVGAFKPKLDGVIAGVDLPDSSEYGVMKVERGYLKRVVEKPRKGSAGTINGGIYVFKPEILEFAAKTPKSERGERELTTTVNMAVGEGFRMGVLNVKGEMWVDVGRPWNVLDANKMLMDANLTESSLEGSIDKSARIHGKAVVEKGAKVLSGVFIEGPVWISAGCTVGPNCYLRPYTYLCEGVRVGNACEIKGSILMEGSHVGHLSYIGDSVLGTKTNLGAGTITANLRFDDQPVIMRVKDEAVSSGRRKLGAFLGDEVKTGINVSLFPGVKVGPESWIGPHVALHTDVPPRMLVTAKFELEMRPRR